MASRGKWSLRNKRLRKAALPPGNCRKIAITLKIPRLGNQSVSDTWSLAKIVRKVEFKLLQLIVASPSAFSPYGDESAQVATAAKRKNHFVGHHIVCCPEFGILESV